MPGGVNSPVRAFTSVGGEPIIFDKVKGCYAWDIDGNKYIDYIGSWGPAIAGHAHDEVLDSLRETLVKGTSFGAPGPLENILAKKVIEAVPSVEMVRFTSSGTEACMGMLRLVRAFTKRDAVIKFDGCYHGHADSFLVQAGSGVATLGLPDSPGVPRDATKTTLVATYNDLASVEALLRSQDCAAVILEPVVGNSGFIAPTKEFLEGLRALTTQYGALLVLERGQVFDSTTDRVFVIGGNGLQGKGRVNGSFSPVTQRLAVGKAYRFRLVHIHPDFRVTVSLEADSTLQQWRAVAKDGADLPARQAVAQNARILMAPGETADFEITPRTPGMLRLDFVAWGDGWRVSVPLNVERR